MAKTTNYRQPGSGFNQSPPNIIRHPPSTMKPKSVPTNGPKQQAYSIEQQQKS